ncbi:HoxN/HupN/NixA family nickel/cobalt transporter [Actinomycetospora endophytica]|uniref:Nickel/cobalt efflux system n=1 Tax=Actinomycetospora endophytica TaxID=2291215 RepID=A0ABS8PJI3_9PSEU|nr:HoxN/HupN/NixA family nickel/cobalt transporter [Actinomycetospora endophytica]MCD2197576.1 HoxN/HupN/NixA family nickel/cobalt transporter [Actinomycetospora endophytica]
MSRPEKRSVAGMAGFILLLHVLGWGTLALVIAPAHYTLGGAGVFGIGLGLTAYLLGMRHAFDADHIAAIDNTTRKLLADGEGSEVSRPRPLSVGFWFSLGHSTIVFVLVLLLGLGVRAVTSEIGQDDSPLKVIGGLIGTAVSGVFLVLIGVINLVVLVGIVRIFRRMRHGDYDEAELERHLDERGFMNRILGRVTKAVRKPARMYPVGVLFGLGFDTATEVSLLVLAGGAAAATLPWWAVLVLPILFAAGMSLFDALDGAFMCFAYGWAFMRPVRKVFYNITITSLSVLVALVIGGIELSSILADQLDIQEGPLAWIAGLDLDNVGFVIVGLFVVAWLVALAVWKVGRVEERWEGDLRGETS